MFHLCFSMSLPVELYLNKLPGSCSLIHNIPVQSCAKTYANLKKRTGCGTKQDASFFVVDFIPIFISLAQPVNNPQ